MAKRPSLTEDNFLKHIFSPKKNALPSGLRKGTLVLGKGRVKARVSAYNRMSAVNQELLKRSGTRDAYLRGESTLKDARTALRQTAVSKGIARPTKPKAAPARIGRSSLDSAVAAHLAKELRDSGYSPNVPRLHTTVPYMDETDKNDARNWKVGQIRAYAGNDDKKVSINGHMVNPLWYH